MTLLTVGFTVTAKLLTVAFTVTVTLLTVANTVNHSELNLTVANHSQLYLQSSYSQFFKISPVAVANYSQVKSDCRKLQKDF